MAGRADIFVAKLDPDGDHLWSRAYGDDAIYQLGWGVAVDGGGNALVIGSFNGTVDFGGGPFTTNGIDDVFVLKLGPDGDHVWSRQFGDDQGNQQGLAIASDAAGNVAITGFHDGPVDFGGGPLPFPGGGDHGLELFVARLDPDGQHVWSRGFADGDHISLGSAITFDAAGNVLVAGGFHESLDLGKGTLQSTWPNDLEKTLFVAKLAPGGETVWSKAASLAAGKGTSEVRGIAASASGDVLVTGTFHDTLDLGDGPLESEGVEAIFVAGLSPDGETRWSRSFGDDPPYQEGRAAAALPQGGWLVTGMFAGTVDFGSGPQTSPGLTSLFVTAFEP